jgi:GR25 family glycosyltransferase involved in LPS biosynthesis
VTEPLVTPTFIMAVPWEMRRLKRARQLRDETSGQLVLDRKHDAFDTFRHVLEVIGEGPGIVLEDDVYLAPNWRERIEAVISQHAGDVIQFFNLRSIDESRYEPGRTFLMNQCYYLPAGAAAWLLEWTSDWVEKHPEHPTGYDVAMAAWMTENRMKYWMSVPSLVQHEKWPSEINPGRPSNRQSKDFS